MRRVIMFCLFAAMSLSAQMLPMQARGCTKNYGNLFMESFNGTRLAWSGGTNPATRQTWVVDSGSPTIVTAPGTVTDSCAYALRINGAGQVHAAGTFPLIKALTTGQSVDVKGSLYVATCANALGNFLTPVNSAGNSPGKIQIGFSSPNCQAIAVGSTTATATTIPVTTWLPFTLHIAANADGAASTLTINSVTRTFTGSSNSIGQVRIQGVASNDIYVKDISMSASGGAVVTEPQMCTFWDGTGVANNTAVDVSPFMTGLHTYQWTDTSGGGTLSAAADGTVFYVTTSPAISLNRAGAVNCGGVSYPGTTGIAVVQDLSTNLKLNVLTPTTQPTLNVEYDYSLQMATDSNQLSNGNYDAGVSVTAAGATINGQWRWIVADSCRSFYIEKSGDSDGTIVSYTSDATQRYGVGCVAVSGGINKTTAYHVRIQMNSTLVNAPCTWNGTPFATCHFGWIYSVDSSTRALTQLVSVANCGGASFCFASRAATLPTQYSVGHVGGNTAAAAQGTQQITNVFAY